jgi:hypothetical protein
VNNASCNLLRHGARISRTSSSDRDPAAPLRGRMGKRAVVTNVAAQW